MSCDHKQKQVATGAVKNGISLVSSKTAATLGQNEMREKPSIRIEAISQRYGRFSIKPLPRGFGVTMGNSLRRTLLSSIKGAAITSVQVNDFKHEFQAIPEVREDMTAFILNLKTVRFKFKEDKAATLSLKVRGEGIVTAADLICPPHLEVVNPQQHLLTADTAKAKLDINLTAETGYGYSPSEERLGLPIGQIALDAAFSPVTRANFKIKQATVPELARRGQFDKLEIELSTDGSLSPEQAVREAASHLAKQFKQVATDPWTTEKERPKIIYHHTLDTIGLQPRTQNALNKAGLNTVLDVMKQLRNGTKTLSQLKGLGQKSLTDLLTQLNTLNLSDGDKEVLKIVNRGQRTEDRGQRIEDSG